MKTSTVLFLAAALCAALPAQAASFNCGKARSYAEKLVCADAELSALDDTLEAARKAAFATTRDKRAFRRRVDEKWLEREKGCRDRACVLAWYQTRIAELRGEATSALTAAAASLNLDVEARPAVPGAASTQPQADTSALTAAAAASPNRESEARPAAAAPSAAQAQPLAETGALPARAASPNRDSNARPVAAAAPGAASAQPAAETSTLTAAAAALNRDANARPATSAPPAALAQPVAESRPAEPPPAHDIREARTLLDKYTLDVAWELFNELKAAGTVFVPVADAPLPAGACPGDVTDKRAQDAFIVYRFDCGRQAVRLHAAGGRQVDLAPLVRAAGQGQIDFQRNCVLKIEGVEMVMVPCRDVAKPGFFAAYRASLRTALGKALASR